MAADSPARGRVADGASAKARCRVASGDRQVVHRRDAARRAEDGAGCRRVRRIPSSGPPGTRERQPVSWSSPGVRAAANRKEQRSWSPQPGGWTPHRRPLSVVPIASTRERSESPGSGGGDSARPGRATSVIGSCGRRIPSPPARTPAGGGTLRAPARARPIASSARAISVRHTRRAALRGLRRVATRARAQAGAAGAAAPPAARRSQAAALGGSWRARPSLPMRPRPPGRARPLAAPAWNARPP